MIVAWDTESSSSFAMGIGEPATIYICTHLDTETYRCTYSIPCPMAQAITTSTTKVFLELVTEVNYVTITSPVRQCNLKPCRALNREFQITVYGER